MTPILHALLAALFYALGIPASKLLLRDVGPATLAALLYLGAGIGIGLLSLPAAARSRKASAAPPLSRRDLPFVAGMILLDVAAPVLLMLGLRTATSANASLLGAAKTSAFYAVAPFAGAFLSFAWLGESLSRTYLAALAVMVAGAALVVVDTLSRRHTHPHRHAFAHRHGGHLHTHVVVHEHDHLHLLTPHLHVHLHLLAELERGAASAHAGTPSTHHPGSSPHVP